MKTEKVTSKYLTETFLKLSGLKSVEKGTWLQYNDINYFFDGIKWINDIKKAKLLEVESLKTNNKSKKGGKREGAGRKPKADYSIRELFKKAFDDNFTEEDWADFIKKAKADPKLITYIIDQRIGKATQAIEHSGSGKDGAIIFSWDK